MEFNRVAEKEPSDKILAQYYRDKLVRRLVIGLDDQIEKNRELCIEILGKLVERLGFKEESQIIIPAITGRLNKVPFPEPCKS